MSLISGSNSLALATPGALDLRADIVEKALLHKVREWDLECPSKYDEFLVEAFPLKQREKDACCCSCRVAVRLTVLSNEDMSSGLIAHKIDTDVKEDRKTIGIDMRWILHDASRLLLCLGELMFVIGSAQPRHSEITRKTCEAQLRSSLNIQLVQNTNNELPHCW